MKKQENIYRFLDGRYIDLNKMVNIERMNDLRVWALVGILAIGTILGNFICHLPK